MNTTYPELPDDVQKTISELNDLINITISYVNPQTKNDYMGNPDLMALHNLICMSGIVHELMDNDIGFRQG